MILACTGCDSRYDVTGHQDGQQFRCRCGTVLTLAVAATTQVGMLSCPQCGAGVSPSSKTCEHCATALLLKACPRCLSRVFHGHKHCPECGTGLDVAAIEAGKERMCPRCPMTPMHGRRVGDVVIDECDDCHGIFLDHVAVQRVITDRQQARAEAILGALPASDQPTAVPPGQRMYVKCPMCATVMNRKLFSTGSGVIIDVCRAHGAFFDAGELSRIVAFVMSGGLEQAHKKDIARLKDEARREQQNAQFSAMMASRSSSTGFDSRSSNSGGALVDLLFSLFR